MSGMLIVVIAWVAVAAPLALLVGRTIRLADRRDGRAVGAALPDFVPAEWSSPAIGSH